MPLIFGRIVGYEEPRPDLAPETAPVGEHAGEHCARVQAPGVDFGVFLAAELSKDQGIFETSFGRDAVVCVCDAELSNCTDLADQLVSMGAQLRSRHAAELIANLVARLGSAAFPLLRGGFSCAVWYRNQLWLAVDRFGMKRLSYRTVPGGIRFSSRAHWAAGEDRSVSLSAVCHYLDFSFVPTPATIFAGVQKLAPGTYVSWRAGEVGSGRYWEMRYPEDLDRSDADLAKECQEQLQSAVRTSLTGLDPSTTGCYLSGGTDSSTVLGMTRRLWDAPIPAFSIGFKEETFSELYYARIAARHFGAPHHEYILGPEDGWRVLPKLVGAFDEPFGNPSAVGGAICAELAAAHGVQVMLAGDGGDEIFGGNERYRKDVIFSRIHALPRPLIQNPLWEACWRLTPNSPAALRLKNILYRATLDNPERFYLEDCLSAGLSAEAWSESLKAAAEHPLEVVRRYFAEADAVSELNRLLFIDLKLTIGDNDLVKVRESAEAYGVRVRFPMLEHPLAEFTGAIPARMKVNGLEKRYLFKRALRDFLPAEVLAKKKHGFGVPVSVWFRDQAQFRELLQDVTNDRVTLQRGYFQRDWLHRIVDEHLRGLRDWGQMLWALLMLELWHREMTGAGKAEGEPAGRAAPPVRLGEAAVPSTTAATGTVQPMAAGSPEAQGSGTMPPPDRSVLMVVHSVMTATGGAEIQAARLGSALAQRGWKVRLLGLKGKKAASTAIPPTVEVDRMRTIPVPGLAGLMLVLRFAWYLVRHRREYQVIHVHIMKTLAFTAAVLGRWLGKTVVLKVSGYDELDEGCLNEERARQPYYRLLNWGCRKASYVIAVSRRTEARLRACGYPEERIVYLPNGIDVERFSPQADGRQRRGKLGLHGSRVGVFVGRFVREKGLFDLLEAWASVHQEYPDSVLCLVGDGVLRPGLECLARADENLGPAVVFAGESKQVEEYLAAADCYVGASLTEGLSNTMLEAMSAGLPVVSTAVSGAEDMVSDGATGYLVPVGDTEALADSIKKVFSDLGRARAMGQNSRALALERFDLRKVIDRYEQLYRNGRQGGAQDTPLATSLSGRALPRVAYMVSLFPCWSETFIAEEIQCLVEQGFPIEIYSLKPASEPHVHEIAQRLLALTRYAGSWASLVGAQLHFLLRRPATYIRQFFRVLAGCLWPPEHTAKSLASFFLGAYFGRRAKQQGVEHIHAHWATYSATGAWTASVLSGIPYSFTTHAHDLYRPDGLLRSKIRDAAYVITISKFNRRILNGITKTPKKIRIVHCGVDLRRYVPVREHSWQARQLLSVGRLNAIKGFDVLIDACRILKQRGVAFSCEIVGDGELKEPLRKQIVDSGLEDCVHLTGFAEQEQVRKKLEQSTMFVLACQETSQGDRDGIPVALMEAMSIGIPVVSTRVSGIPELIEDGRNGLLVAQRDPARLAEAIESLLQDHARCERLAAEARATIQAEFDVRKNAEQLGRLFQERAALVGDTCA